MKEQLIQEIQRKMLPHLNNEQLLQLGDALTEALQGVSVSYEDTTPKQEERDAVEAFITARETFWTVSPTRTVCEDSWYSRDNAPFY